MPDGSNGALRPTVEGLIVRESNKRLIIGTHWSHKAAELGEGNLTTVAGEWRPGESQEFAMRRLVHEEYGLCEDISITPLQHRRFFSLVTVKEYYWAIVKYGGKGGVSPNEQHVASFGWYDGPAALRTAIDQMHSEKALMFKWILSIAIAVEPRLARYHALVEK